MGTIESFLRALPLAAKSPFALIAYVISALLFIASVRQRNQLRTLLRRINDIPKSDRKSAIEIILNTKLPEKLSGEQFLRREKTTYQFLAFIAVLVLVGGIVTIALVHWPEPRNDAHQAPKISTVRVQLWPRPVIKKKFLKDHDARIYLKTDNAQLDVKEFVPTDDFLDATVDVDNDLIGKPVDITISPREKYIVGQDRRYLSRLVRLEVYPLGKKPVPAVTSLLKPSGERVVRTTNLPDSPVAIANTNVLHIPAILSEIVASQPYLLDVQGDHLSANTKVAVVDRQGKPVPGAWAGNELGAGNGRPVEVNEDGKSMKVYFATPPSSVGQTLFWRIENPPSEAAMAPLKVIGEGHF